MDLPLNRITRSRVPQGWYLEEKYPNRPLMPAMPSGLERILIDYGLTISAPPYQKLREELRWKPEKERDRRS